MLKNVLLILAVIILAIGCGENQILGTQPGINNAGNNNTDNPDGDNNNSGTDTKPSRPTIQGEEITEQAIAFLDKVKGKKVNFPSSSNTRTEISADGKTITYITIIRVNGYTMEVRTEYKFQSAKDENTSYYYETVKGNDYHKSYIDKDYYRYDAFGVKDGKLINYEKDSEDYTKRYREFLDVYCNNNNVRDVKDEFKDKVGTIDLTSFFRNKSDIDFASSINLGELK